MHEFLRLKAELARAQQRNDDLRSENRALREALHAAEHEVTNLFAYATQVETKRLKFPLLRFTTKKGCSQGWPFSMLIHGELTQSPTRQKQ